MIEKKTDYQNLVSDGFSDKFARYFINCINEEKNNELYDPEYGGWALSRGFLPSSAYAYGLNEDNYDRYLSDYDYYKIWPINSWSRIWVDDKMTLKYMLDGTEYSDLMPEYYWYSTKKGLRKMIDLREYGSQDFDHFLKSLVEKKEFACKPNNGTGSVGFYKLEYDNNKIFLNKNKISKNELENRINKDQNYIYTEYLHPDDWHEKISPLIHTLRIVVINEEGNNPRILGGYLRFATKNHGESNFFSKNLDDKAKFNFVSRVDFKNGQVSDAKSVYFNCAKNTPCHPDSNVLVNYTIENWNHVVDTIFGISKKLFNVEYMGFDVCFTTAGMKIMEINTHPGIKYMQVFDPFFADETNKKYFETKIYEKTLK